MNLPPKDYTLQEKIIAANKDEIKYYKHINHYLMHER